MRQEIHTRARLLRSTSQQHLTSLSFGEQDSWGLGFLVMATKKDEWSWDSEVQGGSLNPLLTVVASEFGRRHQTSLGLKFRELGEYLAGSGLDFFPLTMRKDNSNG